MRPLPTVSKHPKEVAAEILKEHLDDPAVAIPGAVDEIFEALGIEQLSVHSHVSQAILDAQPYECLRDRRIEETFDNLSLKLGKVISAEVHEAPSVTNDRWNRTKVCTLACWVIRTPEGSPGG
jgi:hypothetical protein